MGKADEVEGGADERSVDDVDGDLEQEISGDATAGFAHGLGQAGEVAVAGEMDEAVAEVFALEEDEEGEDDGEERGGEGFDDAAELIEASGGAADFADLEGCSGVVPMGFCVALGRGAEVRRWSWRCRVVADLLDFSLRAAVGGVAGAVQGLHFLRDVAAVGGEVVGDGDELGEEGPGGDAEESGKGEDDA